MHQEIQKVSKKAGLPPGTLVHIGKKKTENVRINLFVYDEQNVEEKAFEDTDIFLSKNHESKVSWYNIDGIHKVELIETIGNHFELHTLLLEDVLNTQQRPKVEYFEDYLFFTLKMLGINPTNNKLVAEQVSFVLGENYLLSFQERQGDLFDSVRSRIRLDNSKIRRKKADYLLYALIDTVVDNYFLIIEHLSEETEQLEEVIFSHHNNDETLKKIQSIKKQYILLRKSVYPLREAISSFLRDEFEFIDEENKKYLRDLYDHTIHIIESIESQRDVVSGLKDLYMSELSNRMNNIMKVLTIIATIFIPLTFIAGIYGMNFDYMPELHFKWSYPMAWLLMGMVTLVMIIYFKRKKWL